MVALSGQKEESEQLAEFSLRLYVWFMIGAPDAKE